ncbi:MAG: hypothetical protein WCD54_09725, partial [Pseudolabrys sp.]
RQPSAGMHVAQRQINALGAVPDEQGDRANKMSLPKGCCANAVARASDMKSGETPIPVGAANPVISTSAGPVSADR